MNGLIFRLKNLPFSQASKRFLFHSNSLSSSSSLDLNASHRIKQDYVLSNRMKDKVLYSLNSGKSLVHLFQIQTSDLFQRPSFSGCLLKLSADLCDDFHYTFLIFRCIDCLDTFSVNRIIKHYSFSSYYEETIAFYIEMLKDGRFYPNSFTFPPLISACAKMGCLSLGQMCQGQIVKNDSHLLKCDSMLGTFKDDVKVVDKETISVDGKPIKVVSSRNPLQLPWAEFEIDIVIEYRDTN
ncbi:pentatricopeptide repeat-containing protein At3g51320-like [Henckelia pumila]|uniref:pentatricopeptide repeat-containing protein At3g51320-like n=1 Tax=Henckelia pumila TaxID=405737 RepID=UPI003C6E8F65